MARAQYYRKPHSFKKKRPILNVKLFSFGLSVSFLFFLFFYLFLFSEIFQLKEIIVSGQKDLLGEDIEMLAQKEAKKKIGPFPTSSIFLLNGKELEKLILDNFVKLSEVNVKKHLSGSLKITVKERTEMFVFCKNEQCFFLDKEGVIFEEINGEDYSGLAIKDDSKDPILGQTIVDKEDLEKMTAIYSGIDSRLKISLKELQVVDKERWNVLTSENWEIYLNPESDLNWQLTKLSVLLEEKIPPDKIGDLEYVELRFGNFAPYKYK